MLENHLHVEKYAAPDKNICQEIVFVAATNTNNKEAFGKLGRLMKLRALIEK